MRSSWSVDTSRARLRGVLRAGLVLALAGGLSVPAAASATETSPATELDPRGIEQVCPPPQGFALGAATFTDLTATHGDAIACAARYGLVGGFGDGTYRPSGPVTRAQTATAVRGWLELATGFRLDVPAEPPFTDVSGTHAEAIAALSAIGVLTGRDDGTFAPGMALTRGQFAGVMRRAISYADTFTIDGPLPPPPAPGTVAFDDIPGTTFEGEILALVEAQITTGVDATRFAPGGQVTRGQLATFLMRSADYLERHQRWKPTARTVVLVADLVAAEDPAATEPSAGVTARATATLIVNAFDGTIVYAIELAELPGPYAPGAGASLHVGAAGEVGPAVLVLADGAALDAAAGARGIGGTVVQADSEVRFADLAAQPEEIYLSIATRDRPDGFVRGQLRAIG